MKTFFGSLFLALLAGLCLCGNVWAVEDARPAYLRCEYLVDPLGIDETEPRFSWVVESEQRGQRQCAYRLIVSSSQDKLAKNEGDLWDTGKVQSDQSVQVVYKGQPLQSRMRCHWKVKLWTVRGTVKAGEAGKATSWSAPARWSMGLLAKTDWKAQWIGIDRVFETEIMTSKGASAPISYDPAFWIWVPFASPAENAPPGKCYFRRTIELPEGRTIKMARASFAADNSFVLWVNGKEVLNGSDWSTRKTVDVTSLLAPGQNIFAVEATNTGGGPNPAGLIGVLDVTFTAGGPLQVVTDGEWKVATRAGANWQRSAQTAADWADAKAFGKYGIGPWGKPDGSVDPSSDGKRYLPSPHLRKEFKVSGKVAHAFLYVTAQGFAEMHLNGKRVGDEYFTPGWTDYHKRIYYRTYDVTGLLKPGGNAIAGILGDGWYRGNISLLGQNQYGNTLRLMTQLQIDYADGRSETITSDPSWKAYYGPILESDMQAGETYDARREIPGWDTPGYDERGWVSVVSGSSINPLIQAYPGVPVRKTEEVKCIEVTEPVAGHYVFDLGQNFSGWIRLKVKGDAGTKVVMRFAEMLNANGTVYTANLRSARVTDTYILKGVGEEIWEPHFTFHGFRYVQIKGLPEKPTLDTVTGIVVQSDSPMTSSFECSNPLLNKLYSNIVWSQRSNYLDVPTDCPQRDERLGWTGDTQVFIRTGSYNQDVAAFFTKWVVDLMDTQSGGTFGNQAPVFHGHGSPAWADAGIICPWTIYRVYGDTRIIDKHYNAMIRFMGYCKAKGLSGPGGGFGDHLAVGSSTPKELISCAYFGYSTSLMLDVAEELGKTDDAAKLKSLLAAIRAHFQERFVQADGRIAGNSQTAYCLALRYNRLTDAQRQQAALHLVERIKAKDYHLSVGFVGVSILLPTLTDIGRSDLAYRLIQNKTYPSWGYSIEQGATTIWERWNSYTKKGGFGDAKMNSFNHYAYGACGEWMFRSMLGIDTDGIGYKKIVMKPELGAVVTWAKGHYDSIHGRISSDWRVEEDSLVWKVSIPANTTATVYVPAGSSSNVTESGRPIKSAGDVEFLRMEKDRAVYAVGSGDFVFVSKEFQAQK